MLYYFKGKVQLMLGAEGLAEVAHLQGAHQPKVAQEILTYLFFAYGRSKSNIYLDQPPIERKKAVVKDQGIFQHIDKPEEVKWQYIEDLEGVQQLIHRYLETQYTHLQRLRLVLLEKIEKYTGKLADPDATFENEIEADKALELFNRRLAEVELDIMKEEENGASQGAMYLFELPEDVKAFYIKINYEI